MRIFLCVWKGCERYESLYAIGDVQKIFPDGVDTAPSDLVPYQRRIEEVLLESNDEDKIVFNGPAWLIALVGHAWYANEHRQHHNVLVFSREKKAYVPLSLGAIDDY